MTGRRGVAMSLGARRSWWLMFLARAVTYAQGAAAAGDRPADRQDRAVFAHDIACAKTTAFPLPQASAQALRGALLSACAGLAAAERGREREILAQAVEACARGLDQMMNDERAEVAQVWRRWTGED